MKTLPWQWPLLILLAGMLGAAIPGSALAQLSSVEEERLQILSDPDALKKKLEKDKSRAPFECFRSQVAPFDVLPFMKPYQWSTVFLDVRANDQDYGGEQRGTFLIVVASCLVCGKPVCLERTIYQSN